MGFSLRANEAGVGAVSIGNLFRYLARKERDRIVAGTLFRYMAQKERIGQKFAHLAEQNSFKPKKRAKTTSITEQISAKLTIGGYPYYPSRLWPPLYYLKLLLLSANSYHFHPNKKHPRRCFLFA